MFSDLEKDKIRKLFSLNNITMVRKYQKINVPKQELQLKYKYFINFCIMTAQIKLIQFLQTSSEQGKKLQFLVTSNIFGLKSWDSRAFSEKIGKSRNTKKSRE